MLEPCPECGALPCDWVNNPHAPPTNHSDDPMLTPGEEAELVERINSSWYLQPNPPGQSDEALVEAIAKTIAFETMKDMDPKAEPLTDEQWRDNAPEDADFLRGIARAILPIIRAALTGGNDA